MRLRVGTNGGGDHAPEQRADALCPQQACSVLPQAEFRPLLGGHTGLQGVQGVREDGGSHLVGCGIGVAGDGGLGTGVGGAARTKVMPGVRDGREWNRG